MGWYDPMRWIIKTLAAGLVLWAALALTRRHPQFTISVDSEPEPGDFERMQERLVAEIRSRAFERYGGWWPPGETEKVWIDVMDEFGVPEEERAELTYRLLSMPISVGGEDRRVGS